MRFISFLKWLLIVIAVVAVGLFLNFYLPSKDVVRIVGVDVKRADLRGRDQSSAEGDTSVRTRDVRYINAISPSRKPRVYWNEDTGWGFPWYFKFDSGNLQAEAQDAISTVENSRWYVVNHYGWRLTMFSMYPNAISIKEVPGPDHTTIPWFNIAFLSIAALLLLTIWRFVVKLRRGHADV